MTINLKYSQLELDVALIGIISTLEKSQDILEEVSKDLKNVFGENQAEVNVKIAEFHGISLPDLINSPNLEILSKVYSEHCTHLLKDKLMEKLNISDKEAWAILTYADNK